MKSLRIYLLSALVALVSCFSVVNAQEETASESPFSIGADVVSNYVWRGTKFGGPSIQPGLEVGLGNFAIGAWGSFSLNGFDIQENNFYITYSVGNLGLSLTDYYYQGPLFDFSDTAGSHAFEVGASYNFGNFGLLAGLVLNEAPGAGSAGGDLYIEANYAFEYFSLFAGVGNGWYTLDEDPTKDEFGLVNLGISAEKEINAGNLSIPVFGSVIVNPQAEIAYLVVGFSF